MTPIERALRLPRGGSGVLDVREPAALRAALQVLGEQTGGRHAPAVATAFLARWFGRPETEVRRALRDVGRGALVTIGEDSHRPAAPGLASSARTPLRAEKAAAAADGTVEMTGLAALQALDAGSFNKLGAELLEPTAETAAAPSGSAGAPAASDIGARQPARLWQSTAMRTHHFAPTGLRRGRGLFDVGRRMGRGLQVLDRKHGSQRAGYGAAGLGDSELVGLGPEGSSGKGGSFHGDAFGTPGALTGAERLGDEVHARRATRAGRVGRSMAPEMVRSSRRAGGDGGPASGPSDFQFGETGDLVRPTAAVEAAAGFSSSSATGARQGAQAGAMARVLSVTSTDSSNTLPLVAPAARAVVAAAAAKPLSESITTSGGDALLGQPFGASGSGPAAAEGGGQSREANADESAQDLNALANRIARSVMIRLKRERERRGIHV